VSAAAGFGLLLALASALALNWGFLAQHSGASALPPLSLRRPLASLRALFTSGRWLLGFLIGLAGWALYVGALALAPLSLVQAVAAGGIGILALLVHYGRGPERLTTNQWRAVAAAVGGLALLGVTLGGESSAGTAPSSLALIAWLGGLGLAAAVAASLLPAGAGLGAAAGILYGAADVATKAAASGRLFYAAAVVAASVLAFAALQLAYQRGDAMTTVGLSTLLTNALPIAAGVILFRERLPDEPLGAARAGAFGLVLAGAVMLVRAAQAPSTARIACEEASSGDSEITVAGRSNLASASANGSARSVPSP
jgi:hypothetical protein